MIVNPQLFNYRLIKSSIVIVIVVFGVLGYFNYQSIEAKNVFLEQENKLIEHELAEVLRQNEAFSIENESVFYQLQQAEQSIVTAQDSITVLTLNLSVIPGLKTENQKLQKQVVSLSNQLTLSQDAFVQFQNEMDKEIKVDDVVDASINTYEKPKLSTNFLSAQGFETKSSVRMATYKANRVNNLEVCFTLAANQDISSGKKTVYVQIINPENNVFADKSMVNSNGEKLVYSYKTIVEYYNNNTKVCAAVEADKNDKPLKKGTYTINVFNDQNLIGSTELYLD